MTIVIDVHPPPLFTPYSRHDMPPSASVELASTEDFLDRVIGGGRYHYLSRDKQYQVRVQERRRSAGYLVDYDPSSVSLGIQAIHSSFTAHLPLKLSPDTLWYMIVHQVAEHVAQNSDHYAGLFTRTPGKSQRIVVRDDSLRYDAPSDWARALDLFREPLTECIGEETVELFLPSFSTTTDEARTAALVAFMDIVNPYYEYTVVSMCHIPQIHLEGTPQDWRNVYQRAEALEGIFDLLADYFADLLPVLEQIAHTAAGDAPSQRFWSSIYKHESSSGRDWVTGWINAFFAFTYGKDGAKPKRKYDWKSTEGEHPSTRILTNMFPSHVSTVPFVWEYCSRQIDMTFTAGILGIDYDEPCLAPRLGFGVIENRSS